MSESKKKSGLFGKVFKVLSGKPAEGDEDGDGSVDFSLQNREPVDLTFVKNYTKAGGKFLFCESEKDAQEYLHEIGRETGVNRIFCEDSSARSILAQAGIRDLADSREEADAFCTPCEFLVSFNGGIMLSGKQTHGIQMSEWPEVFIVLARTSQIVLNLRSGLSGIRRKYDGDFPSQISTIKGPDAEQDGKTCRKEIYLLLIEDQL